VLCLAACGDAASLKAAIEEGLGREEVRMGTTLVRRGQRAPSQEPCLSTLPALCTRLFLDTIDCAPAHRHCPPQVMAGKINKLEEARARLAAHNAALQVRTGTCRCSTRSFLQRRRAPALRCCRRLRCYLPLLRLPSVPVCPQATVDSFQPTITELTSARVKAELATVELRAKLQVSCEAARRWLRVKL
jgi:hypothetical protein